MYAQLPLFSTLLAFVQVSAAYGGNDGNPEAEYTAS